MSFQQGGRITISVTNDSGGPVWVQPIWDSTYYVYVRDSKGKIKYGVQPSMNDLPIPSTKDMTQLFPGNSLSATFTIPAKLRGSQFDYSAHYWGVELGRRMYSGLSAVDTAWKKAPKGWEKSKQ